MGFFNELVNRATGLKTGLLEEANKSTSGIGMQETDMPVERDPNAMYSDPYTNVKTIDTRLGQTKVASPFKYNNQDHSILMGLLAADNIINGKNHNLWQINTDYESYQEKSTITASGLSVDK